MRRTFADTLRDVRAGLAIEELDTKLQQQIWFELERPHKVLEAAFRETWARIEQATGRPMLLGTPE